jgi:UDP-N-acetylglucosamine:LPS N-acetylglucosamine transferase
MASAYHAVDLVIARSGALTCAELAAVGKFAVLIPAMSNWALIFIRSLSS